MIPLPYRILGAYLLAITLLGAGYFKGRADGTANGELKIAALEEASQQQKQAELVKSSNASATLEQKNAEAQIIYRTITQNVDRVVEMPVYLNTCLEPDGLLLANSALAGVLAPPAASQPNAAVPDARPTQ